MFSCFLLLPLSAKHSNFFQRHALNPRMMVYIDAGTGKAGKALAPPPPLVVNPISTRGRADYAPTLLLLPHHHIQIFKPSDIPAV